MTNIEKLTKPNGQKVNTFQITLTLTGIKSIRRHKMSIDISKSYQTRDGREVRIYAVYQDQHFPVHGAVQSENRTQWSCLSWPEDGICGHLTHSSYDLIPAKTWRAWREGEAPLRIMIRRKGITTVETKRTRDCDLVTLFIHYVRVHEDGGESICGVEE